MAWRIHGTPGHTPSLGCHYCQPHFSTFLWSCIPQSNQASHSQLFCLCASSLHSLGFCSTHHALLSSLKFILVHLTGKGHVDPAQPLNDRSCPHTTNTPKSKTFLWLQCIHRPKFTLSSAHQTPSVLWSWLFWSFCFPHLPKTLNFFLLLPLTFLLQHFLQEIFLWMYKKTAGTYHMKHIMMRNTHPSHEVPPPSYPSSWSTCQWSSATTLHEAK